ncbi:MULTISPECIES: HDOD domain-containing protein [unclassified Duganella]|uniref:HDOD domain-containing protein n=1 Tax=unclassified Duganella TaxID=2636909 RepID=UPI0008859E8A|nr:MULTISPECIES: HDOD domain-containing protein [unclassified Duganella]SDH55031.1 HD-like signal output (HDOD) domain, no enzymatic activity [Duganella sp. OV458]SDK68048.1 HD-like signal output (HDOD) domain, no enzymatic activity [Duganella sp. OV510]
MSAAGHVALDDVVRRIHDLPSLPAVVAELLTSMDEDDIDLHYLAGRIALEPALTAKTLRLANSSFYGMPSKVTSIQQAMSVLGLHSVRTLVTACGVIGAVPPAAGAVLDLDLFWREAIATAVWARALARQLRQSPDTAFTAGLLHQLGTLVLATRFPTEYAAVPAWRAAHEDASVAAAELAVFGVDHAQAGSALAAHWKFPQAIQDAISHQHRANATGLALAVGLAHLLAGPDDGDAAQREQAWQRLAFDDAQRQQLSVNCPLMVNDMCQILVN